MAWSTITSSTVDDFFDLVTATGVTTIAGDWTTGEATPVGVASDRDSDIPEVFYVDQNFPNPFNPSTSITYGIPNECLVSAGVFDVLGREVVRLFDGLQSAGRHTLTLNSKELTSGVYVYRIQAGSQAIVRRIVLLR